LLDLTPRNIFVDDKRWIVIDSEWSFDCPVPVAFVLFRAIREMAVLLQSEIRQTTSASNPAIGLFRRGLNTYYVSVEWANEIMRAGIDLHRMLRWELGFQRYVAGTNVDTVGTIRRHPKIRVGFSGESKISRIVERLIKAVPGMCKLVYFFEKKVVYWRK
jgi:hypothetical protein